VKSNETLEDGRVYVGTCSEMGDVYDYPKSEAQTDPPTYADLKLENRNLKFDNFCLKEDVRRYKAQLELVGRYVASLSSVLVAGFVVGLGIGWWLL
jgi:hypothetical protein